MMVMAVPGISSGFGIERRIYVLHRSTEASHHVLNDMIAANEDVVLGQHDRKMPIAEMPGDADKTARRRRADFRQGLRRGLDANPAAVLQQERIAVAQALRARQVEQKFEPAHSGHGYAAAVALIEVERHLVVEQAVTGTLHLTRNGADHH
jgi:hypothetical protein